MDPVQIVDLPLTIEPGLCRGRTFVVTGANSGLGYEATRHLVMNHAAKVIMAVRSVDAGERARAEIISSLATEANTTTTTIVDVWPLDLSSYESVRSFAVRAAGIELERLDVVVQNAGVAAAGAGTAEGHALSLTVNVLGTMLLGTLLLPKMSETAGKFYKGTAAGDADADGQMRPHLSFVASSAGFLGGGKAWENVKDDPVAGLDAMENDPAVYPASKNLLIQTVRFFASYIAPLSRTGVVVNVLNPGLCATQLDRHAPAAFRAKLAADREDYGRTAEQGSRTLLHGAVAGAQSHGSFLDDCRVVNAVLPPWLRDDDGQKCWEAVREELEKASPGCVQTVVDL